MKFSERWVGGFQLKIPSVEGLWIFSGTTHLAVLISYVDVKKVKSANEPNDSSGWT